MNNRIEQLAKEVTGQYIDLDGVLPDSMTKQEYIKFADLIIAECIHIAVFKDDGMIMTADRAGMVAAGRLLAATLIKEHLGVEE